MAYCDAGFARQALPLLLQSCLFVSTSSAQQLACVLNDCVFRPFLQTEKAASPDLEADFLAESSSLAALRHSCSSEQSSLPNADGAAAVVNCNASVAESSEAAEALRNAALSCISALDFLRACHNNPTSPLRRASSASAAEASKASSREDPASILEALWRHLDLEVAAEAALRLGQAAHAVLLSEQQLEKRWPTAAPLQEAFRELVSRRAPPKRDGSVSGAAGAAGGGDGEERRSKFRVEALLPAHPPALLVRLLRGHSAAEPSDAAAAQRFLEAWHTTPVLLQEASARGDDFSELVLRDLALSARLSGKGSSGTHIAGSQTAAALGGVCATLRRLGLNAVLEACLAKAPGAAAGGGDGAASAGEDEAAAAAEEGSAPLSPWLAARVECLWRLGRWSSFSSEGGEADEVFVADDAQVHFLGAVPEATSSSQPAELALHVQLFSALSLLHAAAPFQEGGTRSLFFPKTHLAEAARVTAAAADGAALALLRSAATAGGPREVLFGFTALQMADAARSVLSAVGAAQQGGLPQDVGERRRARP